MSSTGPPTSSYNYNPIPLLQATIQQDEEHVGTKFALVDTSSVNPSLNERSEDASTQRRGWTSSYLKNASLLAFAATFLSLLLAVIALAVVDVKQNGIANARSDEHYLWTYGPTAVLVIVAALWNQVEYRTKHAMPFAVLQKGPTLAAETLLLDYVTPVIAIFNSLLITLLTVASTGLLVLQETPLTRHDCHLNVTDQFVQNIPTSKIGSASVLATIAISNEPPADLSNHDEIEVEGLTSSFQAGLNCEVATINGNVRINPGAVRNTTLPQQYPAWDLVDGLLTATTGAGTILDTKYRYITYDYFPWSTFHAFFLKWVEAAYPLSNLRDPSVLQSRAEDMFSMVAAQMAKQSLTQPSNVSGLYTAFPTSETAPITLTVRGQFNSSFRPRDLALDTGGDKVKVASNDIGLLLTQNFTFPAWTYDEIALPEATINVPDALGLKTATLKGSNITVTLPGIRSSLNCTVALSVPTNFTDILFVHPTPKANVTAFEALGVNNWHGAVEGSFLPWPRPSSQSFGFFTACGDFYSEDMHNTYCGAFGTSEVNWNAFTCVSHIDELDVEVDLNAASLSVLAARPRESTSRFFSNETLCAGLRDAFPSDMIPSLFGGANFGSQKANAGFYDPAFQAVVYGLGTRSRLEDFSMEAYMNDEGVSRIFDKLQHVHRTVVAQSANLIRMPLNATSPHAPPATVNATLINPHIYRLKQSAVSTRILDGLLVAIALCIAASFLMDTRKVLPKNPASIAAATSLIAGESQMLSKEILPEDAQWHSDAELKEKRVWDGAIFRLGWWDGDGPSEREGKVFKLDTL
ncbi:hypothetical protein E8E12_007931 [Didymella heteroderae]|uniref:Uncharacterized protein n=1 Tax=Didymella heteroderae TaxID=1769908 RepID=A0A9P4WMJ4_9PLEO|nr:hypothetical protein E8E12_007931 [Didymella heteroderae]